MRALGAALAVLLCGAPARAQDESEAAARCGALFDEAGALDAAPASLPDAELRARAAALLERARGLQAFTVRGVRLELPWVADVDAELSPPRGRAALDEAARRLAGRVLFSCGIALADPLAPAPLDRARLTAILQRPEYELSSGEETFLYRLYARVAHWLSEVFTTSAAVRESVAFARTAFLVAAGLFALALAVRVARASLPGTRARAAAAPAAALALEDPEAYRRRAEAALERRDGREAIRAALLALLATLERLRLSAPGRAATNRELAAQLAARGGGELSARAGELFAWYDRVWYGLEEVEQAEARAFLARAGELGARAAERGGGP